MAFCPVSAEIDRHLAREDAAESAAEALSERFACLPDTVRAELLWDFLDRPTTVTGRVVSTLPIFGGTQQVGTVETDLVAAFMAWFADKREARA